MRRFLDWTAAQTAGQTNPSSRRNSQQSLSQHQNQFMQQQQQQQSSNPAKDLEIQHLTKLLHDIKYYQASSSPLPSVTGSQNQREFVDKVHKTLPLFLNVFGNSLCRVIDTKLGSDSCQSSAEQLENSRSESTTSSKPNSPLPPRSPPMDKFPDLLPFAFTIARLFVSEVRQRASNKHSEEASLAILQFLNIKPATTHELADKSEELQSNSIETPQGWNLLLSLNTLALSQSSQIIQMLCDASLPSTLIKCLYLFFDLPLTKQSSSQAESNVEDNLQGDSSSFAREVTRGPLIKAFTQLLVQLCSNQSAIDELIKKDDLRLLIGIASTQCQRHNKPWRKTAFQTLLAISKNMRDNFMYLDQNICIQVYIDNLHRIYSLGLVNMEEFIDMIKTLLEFLYNLDVNNRNQPRSISPLIEQFKSSRIVDLIEELLIKIDDTIVQESHSISPIGGNAVGDLEQLNYSISHQPSVSSEVGLCTDEFRRHGRKLLQSITVMTKISTSQDILTNNANLKPLTTSRFEMFEQFKMPKPSARNCILNYDGLRLFKMVWSKCKDSHMIEAVLDATISLFNDDKYNYFIFESQQLLVYYMTSNNFNQFPYKVKQKLFKFLEFIIIETNYIPCLELGTLGTVIKKKTTSDVDLILGLRTFVACLRFNSKFSDIFREMGLLEVIVDSLIQTMQQDKVNQSTDKLEVLYLLLEASQYLLAGPNNLNCTQFNESGAARHVFNCLANPEFFNLFVPTHSSSSDDSGLVGPNSRTNTPPLSAHSKRHMHLAIHQQHQWLDSSSYHSHNKPSIKQLQKVAFTIIRQLILSTAGDEHLANLLGLLARNLDDLKNLVCIKERDESNDTTVEVSKSNSNLTHLLNQEVNLKICILKSLMIVLKDSHRCRTLFRKAGGFIYIVSSLVTLEKSLPSVDLITENEIEVHNRWKKVNTRRVWRLIKNSLMTIVVAIRFEPTNLRAFSQDVIEKFTEALRNLGCFKSSQKKLRSDNQISVNELQTDFFNSYKSIFLVPPTRDLSTIAKDNIKPEEACCQLFRFLYDMSLDLGDGTAELESQLDRHGLLYKVDFQSSHTMDTKSMSFDQGSTSSISLKDSSVFKRRSQLSVAPRRPPSLDLNSKSIESATLTFPCIILSILDLIPSCPNEDLMTFICLVIKSLFKHERNQQLLCEAGMISKLLDSNWRNSITDKNHFLHDMSEYMLEKLAKQSITAKELRMFLRLEDPLRCKNLDDIVVTESYDETRQKLSESSAKDSLSIIKPSREKFKTDRIESLVAMMIHEKTKIQPPYVEFDMNNGGFSSIFMPSIAPINSKSLPINTSSFLNSTLDVHTNEKNGILGGVGSTERQFPPVNGLTYSTWICIEQFPSRSSDASHNIRLLTIYRGSAATGKEFSCFKIQISALDRALKISTQETLLFDNDNRADASNHDPDCNMSAWTPELLLEGRWHHIAVTMNRSQTRPSSIYLYVDGELIHHQGICYISNYVGAVNSGPLGNSVNSVSSAAFVNAFIGSLPQFRSQLKTRWKQGPCHLLEECLSANFINVIYSLGPNFIGNFQSSCKLNDSAKSRGALRIKNAHDGSAKYQKSEFENQRPLLHQQSAVVGITTDHAHLTRNSSTNSGPLIASHHKQSMQNSHSQYSLSEDRILISIDARATSLMTLARMRRIYTRFDCRQVSRVLGLALHENSTPILILHNTGVHLNGPSRGIGALTIGYNHVRCFVPSPTQYTLYNIGGSYIFLGLIAQTQNIESLSLSLKSLVYALKHNVDLQSQMDNINGYQMLAVIFWKKKHLLNSHILKQTFSLITNSTRTTSSNIEPLMAIQQVGALRELICECFDLWLQTDLIDSVLEFIYDLISSSNSDQYSNSLPPTSSISSQVSSMSNLIRAKNLKCLRDMDLLPRMLRLLPQYDSQHNNKTISEAAMKGLLEDNIHQLPKAFDTKAIYLIRQTVFELLNRTPRQSDILYFGQFLASLLPSKNKERPIQTINLRNILLKSLLQMMTKNKQKEVNNAMQEELVRILGFDWFMLFISCANLNSETITLGFLNLMIVLSNDDLYASFKSKSSTSSNGGWLKEPTFPTIDAKFNIQLLGINVGVFFGLNGKRKSIKKEVLEAPNFFLLTNCLTNLIKFPRVYLMIFFTMMGRLTKIDPSVIDTIETFESLNLDVLCDCLVGDTHHKRRKTLSGTQFKCHELVVCIAYMIREIMCNYDPSSLKTPSETTNSQKNELQVNGEVNQHYSFPFDLARFLMYLYNNNQEFQQYCRRSDELIDGLCETLIMQPVNERSHDSIAKNLDDSSQTSRKPSRPMTQHPALKEILELARLIILDTMTDPAQSMNEIGVSEQLHTFERFLESLSVCKEAQGELVDMLLRQVLLMIDSTARHNSIKTIGGSENILQFQYLLINSITISQIVTDKIWLNDLYSENLNRISVIIDHQLCLAEQIFKFNELLPKHNPPHAFIMQRVLNRILLFALSRPLQHMSDKILMLDLLKKIHDNRTIIILNHMHSPQSAEFFVCFVNCLMKIIEENTSPTHIPPTLQQSTNSTDKQPSSLIERQYGHPNAQNRSLIDQPGLSSSALMLSSMARKIWDSIYQSKKGILSEAFDVSLSLPAFTLDTSLDLLQIKPDIAETCERYWTSFIENEQKPRRRIRPQRLNEPSLSSGAASTAVNILSGRLTRVVNAASFVSRVVGATAGTMASNVNLVGEKLSQTRTNKQVSRTSSDTSTDVTVANAQTSNISNTSGGHQQSSNNNSHVDQNELFKFPALSKGQLESATKVHISIIEEFIESQMSQKNHKLALHKYLCDEWLDTEYEVLLRERALFGPDYGSELDKWCLDLTEGPRRMRKKMVNNTSQFYNHYPYTPEQYNPSNKSLRYRPPMSYDSHSYYMKTLDLDSHLLELVDVKPADKVFDSCSVAEQENDTVESGEHIDRLSEDKTPVKDDYENKTPFTINVDTPSPIKLHSSIESLTSLTSKRLSVVDSGSPKPPSECDLDDGDSTSFVDFSPEIEAETNSARDAENVDSLSVLRLLEKNERISHMFRCSRVQGLDTYEGLLLFGREHFYLIDGFTLLKTREIKDIDSLPADAHDPIIPNSTPNILAHSKKTCSKFSFDSVIEVHKRRYLLQPIALEVFSSDGRNTLIVFPRNIRNKVYSRLMTVSTQLTSNAHESLAGQKSNVSVEGGSGLLSNLIGETSVTQRWVRGELSNFQYLMNLNTIAGRSYNDLMQYPIFPWILAEYTSDYLDLNKPSTFRDLSRPVGAQTSERLEQFKRRYADWDDIETPPYHYGTFYSSAMIVASFMVRMEPFTQHFLRLQGGHFDLADRMFHSIQDSWLSASKHNMADIKELVPEFFYLPEFLKNENKYDLGIKQNGKKLDDVILPPWAKNDTREFIRLHRCALESDYVSAHLNEWIDLIFGYKQQGQPAVDAVNVFHHLFYEGNVDIYNTDIDPIKKNAVIGFINNFGQVPKQLFKKPHPVRKIVSSFSNSIPTSIPLTPILPSLSTTSTGHSNQRVLTHYPHLLKQAATTFKDLKGPVGQIVQMDKNVVAVEQNKLLIPPEYCRYIAWGHADRSLRLSLYDSEKPIFVWEGSDNMPPNEILSCTIPNNRTMITAGTEALITVWKIEKMRSFVPVLNLYGHVEPVTCLASSQSYSIIVSGSRDRTAIIWDLNRFTFVRQLGGGGSANEKCAIQHQAPVSAIAINDSTGDIATCASSWLYLWTINGELLAHIDSLSISIQQSMYGNSSICSNLGQLHILSVCFSQHNEWDLDEVVITGASDGSIALWSMRYYQSPLSKAEIDKLEELKKETNSQREGDLDKEAQDLSLESIKTPNCTENEMDKSPLASEPINIERGIRQRTDTMNSEWVKLSSVSSTSTIETIPASKTTQSSKNNDSISIENADREESSNFPELSTDLFFDENQPTTDPPRCSTPVSPSQVSNIEPDNVKDESTLSNLNSSVHVGDDVLSSNGAISTNTCCDDLDGQSMSSKANLFLNPVDPSLLKFSKSDTSLVDSFVILGDTSLGSNQHQSGNDRTRPQSSAETSSSKSDLRNRKRLVNQRADHLRTQRLGESSDSMNRTESKLLPNHCWKRELYLRTLLPRRNTKAPPMAVTSLAVSKDHRTIFVGDASGRISSWSTS